MTVLIWNSLQKRPKWRIQILLRLNIFHSRKTELNFLRNKFVEKSQLLLAKARWDLTHPDNGMENLAEAIGFIEPLSCER